MKVNKFISILLIFVFIVNISMYSLATNETNIQNQENEIDMNTDNIEELDARALIMKETVRLHKIFNESMLIDNSKVDKAKDEKEKDERMLE